MLQLTFTSHLHGLTVKVTPFCLYAWKTDLLLVFICNMWQVFKEISFLLKLGRVVAKLQFFGSTRTIWASPLFCLTTILSGVHRWPDWLGRRASTGGRLWWVRAGYHVGFWLGWWLTNYHGNPKPSFLGVITHTLGCKTFIFHGFGVEGYDVMLEFDHDLSGCFRFILW